MQNAHLRPFDVDATALPGPDVPPIVPWRRIPLDPQNGGSWVVAGDLDGDGQAELISAQNFDRDDVHYTSAVVAQRLDGTVMWRWGDPAVGRRKLHHDVACQIHDRDGDGCNEVILCHERELIELDGITGRERRRFAIPPAASDSIVFANLSGGPIAREVLVKDRYQRIWAMSPEGKILWHVDRPAGFLTAHQPRPIDIDGDGREEIMAGYALLNPDGSVRWVHRSSRVDLSKGHLDCMRPLRLIERSPQDSRLVITCCGAEAVAMIDGHGKMVWEVTGHHFESIDVGKIHPDVPGQQIVVDIDHRPWGQSPLWLLDEQGQRLGQIMTNYSRHHDLIADPKGRGASLIAIASTGLFDAQGRHAGFFQLDPADGPAGSIRACRFDAHSAGLLLAMENGSAAYAFRFDEPQGSPKSAIVGMGINATLY